MNSIIAVTFIFALVACDKNAHREYYLSPEKEFFNRKGFQLDSIGYKEEETIYFPNKYLSVPPESDSSNFIVYSSYQKQVGRNATEHFEVYKLVKKRTPAQFTMLVHRIEYQLNKTQVERVSFIACPQCNFSFYHDTAITKWQLKRNKQVLDSLFRFTPKGYYLCGTAAAEILRQGEGSSRKLTVDEARKTIHELLTR